MLKVKNACPKAAKTMCEFNFEKSGLNMYSIPILAFGSLRETTTKKINISANKGIRTLFVFSIPFFIPLAVTNTQMNKNTRVSTQD